MWLKELKGKQFDLVFMDAAKGQYLNWLPLLLDLMPVGAVLISDNVLQDGDVVQSRLQCSAGTVPSTAGCVSICMN